NVDIKKQSVPKISESYKGAESSVVVDCSGLDVAEITALHNELRDKNVTCKVYKGTMIKRTVADAEIEGLNDILAGPTAIGFGNDDVIVQTRILYDFAKDHEALEIKGGVIQGEVAPVDQLKELSTLPDHDGLISMLLSVLQAPIRNLAY